MESLGKHILVEYYNCDQEILNDPQYLEKHLRQAADEIGATFLNQTTHSFFPWGVSSVVVIQESHLAIHTWPEHSFASVDLFTCGDLADTWKGFKYLLGVLKAKHYSAMEMKRGVKQLLPEVDEEGLMPVGKEPQVIEGPSQKSAHWYIDILEGYDGGLGLCIKHKG